MPLRVLLADDNPLVRKSVRRLLEEPGREIFEAENGQQAIALALEHHPHVAVFDLAMPVMDGLTAAREVHNHLPELPILMYTMHWSSQLEVETIKSGIRKVIAKSDSSTLVAAVKEVLEAVPPPTIPPPVVLAAPVDPAAAIPQIEASQAPAEAIAAEPPASIDTAPNDPTEPQA